MYVAYLGLRSFCAFASSFSDEVKSHCHTYGLEEEEVPDGVPERYGSYLQDYLAAWLERGDGIEATGKDFAIYLQTVILVTQKWLRDPTILHRKEGDEQSSGGVVTIVDRGIRGIYQAILFHDQSSFPCGHTAEERPHARVLYRDYYELLASVPPEARAAAAARWV